MSGVLFVCTGNICRSPMAEYLARHLTPEYGMVFSSAGTGTHPRVGPSSGTTKVMAELGIDLEGHRSRSVWEDGDAADVIFALSAEHRSALVARWPGRVDDIHMLRPDGGSIDDPYGMELGDYRRSRDEIAHAIRARVETGWKT